MIEIELYGYTIRILKQDEYPWLGYLADNGVELESNNVPDIVYCGYVLRKIYLRGVAKYSDNSPLVFYNIEDVLKAIEAIKDYCHNIGVQFKLTTGRTVIDFY